MGVTTQHLLGRRLVKGAVDPHRPKQGVADVFLEPFRRLGAAVAAVVDVARPTVVGPSRCAEADIRRQAPGELGQLGAGLGERLLPVEETWLVHSRSSNISIT